MATVLAVTFILSIVAVLRWSRRGREHTGLYLSVDWREADTSPLDALA